MFSETVSITILCGCSAGTLWTGLDTAMVQNADVTVCLATPDCLDIEGPDGRIFLGAVGFSPGPVNKVVYLDSPYAVVNEWTDNHDENLAIRAVRIIQ